jgi:hypothetical protein
MKRLTIVSMAVCVLMVPRAGRPQSPSLSAARVHASVDFDRHNLFVYRYTLENGAGSTAAIWRLAIDISTPTAASGMPASDLTHGPGYFVPSSTGGLSARTGRIVQVGLSAPQPGWRTTVGTGATAQWMAVPNTNVLLPNQKLAGFSLASHAPPSLRRFTIAPYIDPARTPVAPPADDPGEQNRYEQEFEQYVGSRSVSGITLGPAAGPGNATAGALLTDLARQLVQARALGWIANDASAQEITDKLDAAQQAIARHDADDAVTILQGLRTDLATQSGKTLTSEGVALVDLNIQYALPLVAKP